MACSLTQLPPRQLTNSLSGQTRWWDLGCRMPPVGMVSKITWGQPCRLVARPWEQQSWYHFRPQDGSSGCAGSSEVQWQQPGLPKSPDHLKHAYRGGRFKVKLGRLRHSSKRHLGRNQGWRSELNSSSWGKKGRNQLLTAPSPPLSGSRPYRCLKSWPEDQAARPWQRGRGKEVARRALTSSVAWPLEAAGYKLLCDMTLPLWKQVCQCWHCTWKIQHSMYMLSFLTWHHTVFESTTRPGLRTRGYINPCSTDHTQRLTNNFKQAFNSCT